MPDTKIAPVVGVAFTWGEQTIVPTYVAVSERPTSNGACVTEAQKSPGEFRAAGWYVEFRYPRTGDHNVDTYNQYRGFIPFEEAPDA